MTIYANNVARARARLDAAERAFAISQLPLIDQLIGFVEAHEGPYGVYGGGTSALMSAIAAKMRGTFPDASPLRPAPAMAVSEALHEVLIEACGEQGMKADKETYSKIVRGVPGKNGMYRVGWESGPAEWAIHTGAIIKEVTGVTCEPNYSFDLILFDMEIN